MRIRLKWLAVTAILVILLPVLLCIATMLGQEEQTAATGKPSAEVSAAVRSSYLRSQLASVSQAATKRG